MSTIQIGTGSLFNLRSNFEPEISRWEKEGLTLRVEEAKLGKFNFLNFTFGQPEKGAGQKEEDTFRQNLTLVVTNLLLGEVSQNLLRRMIRIDHPYLTSAEAELLSRKVLSSLTAGEKKRIERVQKEVSAFLSENNAIFLEGFFRFRLKDYFSELKENLEEAIDQLLADKEYQEFIKLLRYFVEIQEPKIPEVHVLFYSKEKFRLLDEEEKPLEQEYLLKVLGDLKDEGLKYEDLLLSALITLSPERIILHHSEKTNIVNTIVNVFAGRVTFCRDCELCRNTEGN
ncbi:MAG TPA: putative sporulation protein YtxC [Capillibacterium sp.]